MFRLNEQETERYLNRLVRQQKLRNPQAEIIRKNMLNLSVGASIKIDFHEWKSKQPPRNYLSSYLKRNKLLNNYIFKTTQEGWLIICIKKAELNQPR